MNTLKKIGYTGVGVLTTASVSVSNAANSFGFIERADKVKTEGKLAEASAENTIGVLIGRLLMFLGLLGVIYALWGGFLILTAAGNDDQVKKGRQVIVHAIIGIIVIFLSYSIIKWVLDNITQKKSVAS